MNIEQKDYIWMPFNIINDEPEINGVKASEFEMSTELLERYVNKEVNPKFFGKLQIDENGISCANGVLLKFDTPNATGKIYKKPIEGDVTGVATDLESRVDGESR